MRTQNVYSSSLHYTGDFPRPAREVRTFHVAVINLSINCEVLPSSPCYTIQTAVRVVSGERPSHIRIKSVGLLGYEKVQSRSFTTGCPS